ncbi:MAG: hypothetical protein KG075_06400 [Alphaproteobacteria bacterium]|nr:hypothetical protein [Alphaproteobacteria bacterium]MBS4045953.1 hypothetical protein [Alphaproteobacteria bacterium]
MIRNLSLAAMLGLAACNMQSPKPVYTAEEAEARRVCETHVHSDMRYGGAGEDPVAACMQAYRAGWGRNK